MASKQPAKQSGSIDTGILVLGAAAILGGAYLLMKKGGGAAALIGIVTSGEDGTAIANANVLIGEQTAFTDSNGVFTIENLPTGSVTVIIEKSTYISYESAVILAAGDNHKAFQLFKTSTGAGLSGTITNVNTGQPVAGVLVTASGKTTTTDAGGTYSIPGLNAGTVLISFSKQWYASKSQTVNLQIGPNTLNVTMDNYGTVAGTVRDSVTSAYLSGVTIQTSTGQSTTTNSSGQYNLRMASGPATISAQKNGYIAQNQPVTPQPGVSVPLDFALVQQFENKGWVQGTVSDAASGAPIVGANLIFTGPDTIAHTTQSGAGGAYQIELPSDSDLGGIGYSITVTKSGYYNWIGSQGVRTGAYHTKNISMTPVPVPPGAVHGYVVNGQTGFPIYNVRVVLQSSDATVNKETHTDAEGFYDFENIAPGPYDIWAIMSGYSQSEQHIYVNSGQVTNVPNFSLVPQGSAIGFHMQVDFDPSNYPSASKWWVEVNGMVANFLSVNTIWDGSMWDMTTRSWPAQMTVELYNASNVLLQRNVKSVTLVNGHVYSFLVNNAGGQLIDEGTF